MANIIKTAIITIIISFISGLLLEYYKNLAPRLLCRVKNAMPIKINNEKICAYIITVSNVSNKTIHDLTLYIQSPHTKLKIADAKITKGLKFDSSTKDKNLDVYIPFLSKDDKFSVTVYAENQYEMLNKPVIIIRSPENFKQINSLGQNGILSSLLNIPKNIYQAILKILKKPEAAISNKKDDFTMVMNKTSGAEGIGNVGNRRTLPRNKKPSNTKKTMIAIVSIILLIFVGVLGKSYLKGLSTNTSTPDVKTITPNHSNSSSGSSGTTKNANSKPSTKKANGNANSSTSTENAGSNISTEETKGNTDSKPSTEGTNKNTDSKASTGETKGNTGSKASTGETKGSTDSKASTEGTNKNTDSKTSTGGTTGNTNSKPSSGVTNENTGN